VIRRLLVLLALTAGLAGRAPNASACTCAPLSFDDRFAMCHAVFLGEVLEVVSAAPEVPNSMWARIRVEASWKGDPAPIVRVLTSEGGGSCGVPFTVGQRYLVFAIMGAGEFGLPAGELRTNICLRTHDYWAEDPDLALLGAPPPPAPQLGLAVTVRPNPSQGPARLVWTIPQSAGSGAHMRLDVLDVFGRRVVTLADGPVEPGPNQMLWDGRDARGRSVAAGLYRVRLECAGRVVSQSLVKIGS